MYNFQVNQVEKTQSFGDIPDGVYQVVISEAWHVSDEKSTRFEITLTHTAAPYKNRKTWARHMYIGNATTKKVALDMNKSLLADLLFVAGIEGFKDEQEADNLGGKLLGLEMKIKIRNSEFQGKNFANVDGYWKLDGSNRSGIKLPAAKAVVTKEDDDSVPF